MLLLSFLYILLPVYGQLSASLFLEYFCWKQLFKFLFSEEQTFKVKIKVKAMFQEFYEVCIEFGC